MNTVMRPNVDMATLAAVNAILQSNSLLQTGESLLPSHQKSSSDNILHDYRASDSYRKNSIYGDLFKNDLLPIHEQARLLNKRASQFIEKEGSDIDRKLFELLLQHSSKRGRDMKTNKI
eukprot:g3021.t1